MTEPHMIAVVLHLHWQENTVMFSGDALVAAARLKKLRAEFPDERFVLRTEV